MDQQRVLGTFSIYHIMRLLDLASWMFSNINQNKFSYFECWCDSQLVWFAVGVIHCRTFRSRPGRTQSDGALSSGHVCFVSVCLEHNVLLLGVCDQVRMHSEGVSADSISWVLLLCVCDQVRVHSERVSADSSSQWAWCDGPAGTTHGGSRPSWWQWHRPQVRSTIRRQRNQFRSMYKFKKVTRLPSPWFGCLFVSS